jgi:hypothetical protein
VTAHAPQEPKVYGLLAEFDDPEGLINAAKKAREAGYRKMDGYSPYGLGEVADAIGFRKSEMGTIMFIGGLIGVCAGFLMQYWTQAVDYQYNVGGRPLNSWPQFVPITFELMVLTASLSGLFGLIALCGLPLLNHPLFNVKAFDRASQDRFFLCIESRDPKYDPQATRAFLAGLQPSPLSVEEVPT